MRKSSVIFGLVVICVLWTTPNHGETKSLKDIYKTGHVRFEEVLRISSDTLPEGVGIKFFGDLYEDKAGNIFILDSELNRILKLDAKGKLIKTIGQKGQGPGDLYVPQCMTLLDNKILVYEFGNKRFSLFDLDGNFIRLPISKGVERKGLIPGIESLPNGNLVIGYISGSRDNRSLQEIFLEIYTQNFQGQKILYSGTFSMFKLIKNTKINHPYYNRLIWDKGPGGKIAFGFSDKFEIKIYDSNSGKTILVKHNYQPIAVTEEMKEEYLKQFSYDGGPYGEVPKYIRKYTEFPSHKPAFSNIVFDTQGNMLVFPEEKSTFFYAFDSKGKFIEKAKIMSGEINTDTIRVGAGPFLCLYRVTKSYDLIIMKCRIQEHKG